MRCYVPDLLQWSRIVILEASVSITGAAWVERSSKLAASGETLEIRLGKEGKANVLVSSVLANLERAFLEDPAA
jgi:DNA phosphorothioation-dependent restriction protein DptH